MHQQCCNGEWTPQERSNPHQRFDHIKRQEIQPQQDNGPRLGSNLDREQRGLAACSCQQEGHKNF